MQYKYNDKEKLLKKKGLILLFFLITSFIFINNVYGASFNFEDFDFDEFAKKNLGYWTDQCAGDTQTENCPEKIISAQKHYYTRLYKILAKQQRKTSQPIDDNIIISTTFFGFTPSLFNDTGENYNEFFGTSGKAYNYGDDDLDNYDVDAVPELEWFENETDTLDLLIRNLFSYSYSCYAVYDNMVETTDEDGNVYLSCPDGGVVQSVGGKTVCATKASSEIVTFLEYASLKNAITKILSIFGLKSEPEKDCNNKVNDYPNASMEMVVSSGREYNPEGYWKFLEESNYLDKKPHLQSYYFSILAKTEHKNMTELSAGEFEEYEDKIIEIRKMIVQYIKEPLENRSSLKKQNNLLNIKNTKYWWPIGSEETTESGGVLFATGEPASISISSNYGERQNPITGENEIHYGVDIYGTEGLNIIATKDGIVKKIVNNCESGDKECGSGYGNHVVLNHGDGNLTYYAHLQENSITVSENQSVKQGQVIGAMGNTGASTSAHLHYEVRVGSDNLTSAVNPLDYISAEEPRQSSITTSELYEMLMCLEGKGAQTDETHYMVYDDAIKNGGGGTLTAGSGVTLLNNRNRFAKYGIDVDKYLYHGASIPKDVVDQIKMDIISTIYDSINTFLNKEGISLLPYQIDALVSRQYNIGNINTFPNAYKTYGNTEALYNNCLSKPTTAVGFEGHPLKSRREREWNLFHNGVYFKC